ncbi:flotillin family protein [Tepidibacter formicigenes]|uniref:Flotillin n=1 Tax=Tepidibacter formicigenes DSM 15518 TaxID=1123349 RepID=A0A1M6K2T5_9FIRM|nr:SPFH domain-containing protein [Tepidibacter formicigenes]SHJ53299.1 flotillin [Tepidibacter formicigenes DSM 15518]
MLDMSALIYPAIIVGVILILIMGFLSMWKKVPQDKARVVTGLKKRVISGGGGLVIPLLERTDIISLENMKIEVRTDGALTEEGVEIIVDGVTVVKVKSDEESILSAMEQFNTGNEKETIERIKVTSKDVLEGKLREIISTMTVEEIYKNREKFTAQVQEVAAVDLAQMGLEIKAFTIRDIADNHDYLNSLGKKRIAEVKRDAEIAQAKAKSETEIKKAEAERDAKIQTAIAFKEGERARLESETEIAEFSKNKELKVQSYRQEQQVKKAQADLAYEIEQNKVKKEVVETEMEVKLLEKDKSIEIADKESLRIERELDAKVKKQADANKYEAEKRAEAENYKQIKDAHARAEAIKLEGQARAEAKRLEGLAEVEIIKEKGKAEAEAMREKAQAFKEYNEAAVIQMLVEKLPEIASSIATPLSKTEKIVIVDNGGEGKGASKVSGYITDIMAQVPEAVEALTGVNIMDMVKNKFDSNTSYVETIEPIKTMEDIKKYEEVKENNKEKANA